MAAKKKGKPHSVTGDHSEYVIEVGLQGGGYDDGDILRVHNAREIKFCHAQKICHTRHCTFTSDGLRPPGTLPEVFLQRIAQYKLERVSPSEVKRTDLGTLDETIHSMGFHDRNGDTTPNLELFLKLRMGTPRHAIFGALGAEYWYGNVGRRATLDNLDMVWQEIEGRTTYRQADHIHFPIPERALKCCLIVCADDMDDEAAGNLTRPLTEMVQIGEYDPDENPPREQVVRLRECHTDWRALDGVIESDVLDVSKPVDIRDTLQPDIPVIAKPPKPEKPEKP